LVGTLGKNFLLGVNFRKTWGRIIAEFPKERFLRFPGTNLGLTKAFGYNLTARVAKIIFQLFPRFLLIGTPVYLGNFFNIFWTSFLWAQISFRIGWPFQFIIGGGNEPLAKVAFKLIGEGLQRAGKLFP